MGTAVDHRNLVGPLSAQSVQEKFTQQMVVPIPVSVLVQRNEQELIALQSLQHRGGIEYAGDRTAQGGVHPVENGRFQQEVDNRLRLGGKHILEILGDRPRRARDGADESERIGRVEERDPRKLQSGRPTLRGGMQLGDARCTQLARKSLAQKVVCLLRREP